MLPAFGGWREQTVLLDLEYQHLSAVKRFESPSPPPRWCSRPGPAAAWTVTCSWPPRHLNHLSPPPRWCSRPGPAAAWTVTCSWPPRLSSTSMTYAGPCCCLWRPPAFGRSHVPLSCHRFPPRLRRQCSSYRDPTRAADLTRARGRGLRHLLRFPVPHPRQSLQPLPAPLEGGPPTTAAGGEGRGVWPQRVSRRRRGPLPS